jgi:hypothetical protein
MHASGAYERPIERREGRLVYSAANAKTREQYALPSGAKRAGTVKAGDRKARNSPAEQPR